MQPSLVWICPGFADRPATQRFVETIWQPSWPRPMVVDDATYRPDRVVDSIAQANPHQPIGLIGFSAGVVAALGAAKIWQRQGGRVRAVFAWDGWGVPLPAGLSVYRFSHDRWTHDSSNWLGSGREQFWADPGLPHLDFWRSPDRATGWWCAPDRPPCRTTAAAMLQCHLQVLQSARSITPVES